MRFVLDCSVTLSWAFEDERDSHAIAILQSLKTGEALVPGIWPLEVANGLIVAERKNRLSEADAAYFAELLNGLEIKVDAARLDYTLHKILPLAREHKLSAYDASYLDLALREGLPLATRDQKLRLAARHCGVPLAGK